MKNTRRILRKLRDIRSAIDGIRLYFHDAGPWLLVLDAGIQHRDISIGCGGHEAELAVAFAAVYVSVGERIGQLQRAAQAAVAVGAIKF
jgi:hypothetical protein